MGGGRRQPWSSLHFLAASVLVASRAASCAELDSCSVEQFMDAADIVSLCCESAPGLCRETFPTTCSHTCARTIVPYMDRCGSMVESMSDAVFTHFHLSQLPAFASACRQTLVLFQNAASTGLCDSGSGLISRVDAVNGACCEQNGHNVCTGGEPAVCDAECAAEFLPYWHQCLDRASTLGGEMHPFNTLHSACTDGLPQAEVMALYRDVTEMEDSPECTIDTSNVVPMTEAKQNAILPTCETDTFSACAEFIANGLKTCEGDFCELCSEAHTCDHSCGLPCAEATGHGGSAGGHYRLLEEEEGAGHIGGWAASLAQMTEACPLSAFEPRIAAVDALCCTIDGAVCVDGMPESCPYACGRGWTEFFRDCESVINAMFDNADQFSRLTDRCLQVDPVGMTLALAEAVCIVCGDGVVGGREECDDGAQSNSDEQGGACRTNCMRAHCGDGVIDPGEACDAGRANCADCDCGSDCTRPEPTCRELRCGKGTAREAVEATCTEAPRCAHPDELNEVSCCADTAVAGFVLSPYGPTTIWGERDPNGSECQHGLNYHDAEAFCTGAGGRLCTAAELEAGCTSGSGCQFDNELNWSSTSG